MCMCGCCDDKNSMQVYTLCSILWVGVVDREGFSPSASKRVPPLLCLIYFGISRTQKDLRRQHRHRWLRDVARTGDSHRPKQLLLGAFTGIRPRHGPHKSWCDVIVKDFAVHVAAVQEQPWYPAAQDRPAWRLTCGGVLVPPPPSVPTFQCAYFRSFRRSCDLKRHQKYWST